MKLKKGQSEYNIKGGIGMTKHFFVHSRDMNVGHSLPQLSVHEMSDLHWRDTSGMPIYYAVDTILRKLIVYPTPDKTYHAELAYYPPIKVI